MTVLTINGALRQLCRLSGKWGMCAGFWDDPVDEIIRAAPWLQGRAEANQAIIDGHAFLLFDDEDECTAAFGQTVGHDGLARNPYAGPARVYAVTCDPEGQIHNENTQFPNLGKSRNANSHGSSMAVTSGDSCAITSRSQIGCMRASTASLCLPGCSSPSHASRPNRVSVRPEGRTDLHAKRVCRFKMLGASQEREAGLRVERRKPGL
jgi:hypothetical protein